MRLLSSASALLLTALAWAQTPLDRVVARAMETFQVPGVAVAVVKDGRVVVARGYGVRRAGEPAPVTPRTLFGIASNTKVFTAAALAQLVDEGRLAWDDRVVDRLPGFQMADPYVTREMRIRDLLCHRSGLGLGAGDLMFWPPSDLTEEQVLRRIRHVPLATSFRSAYAYDNLLYVAAGAVLKEVGGKPWASVMQERFFGPLGMADSLATVRNLRPGVEVVTPHVQVGGRLQAVAHQPLDNNLPAAAILSSAQDMAQWVKALLAKGDLGQGRRIFSEAQGRVLETPLTLMPTGRGEPLLAEARPTLTAYALGLQVQDYRGARMVWHTGSLAGQMSRVTLLPELGLGVVVLTNAEVGEAFHAITLTVLDQYLQAPPKDWVAAYQETRRRKLARAAETVAKAAAARDAASRPSRPLAAYAGRYRDPWYGDVLLEVVEGRLRLRFTHTPALQADLEPWQQDTFIARWPDRSMDADAYVTFALHPDGTVREIRMAPISPNTDFSYDFQDLRLTPVPASASPY